MRLISLILKITRLSGASVHKLEGNVGSREGKEGTCEFVKDWLHFCQCLAEMLYSETEIRQ